MSPFPLGILASSGGVTGSFDLLETVTLGTSQASITLSNLNTNYGTAYKHLQLRFTGSMSTYGGFYMYYNGDGNSNGNYYNHGFYGTGTGIGAHNQADAQLSYQWSGGLNATIVDILEPFNTNKYTAARSISGNTMTGSGTFYMSSHLWKNTAAVTSLQLFNVRENLPAGFRVSLYGLKGA